MIFYVSSLGASATAWLARALNLHPRIVCWHGTRSIPPVPSSRETTMAPEAFARGLRICAESTGGTKVFGAVHGYRGLLVKDAIEGEGGRFSAVIRHPVRRMHSLLSHYAGAAIAQNPAFARFDGLPAIMAHLEALGFPERAALEASCRGRPEDAEIACVMVGLLHHCFDRTVEDDVRIAEGCAADQVVAMERLVSDREAFAAFVAGHVAPGSDVSGDVLDAVFALAPTNRHAEDGPEAAHGDGADAVYDGWPRSLRLAYVHALGRFDGAALDRAYGRFGYDYRR